MKRLNIFNWVTFMVSYFRFQVDGGDGGGGVTTKPEPQTFSVDYVRELREENKAHRLSNQELAAKLKVAEDAKANADKDVATKLSEAQKASNQRVLMAELKVAAKEAGLIDLDALKLADLSKVVLKDDGTIDGVDTLFKGLKESKPYLFGSSSSSSQEKTPEKKEPEAKKAQDMTKEEYAAEKAKLLK